MKSITGTIFVIALAAAAPAMAQSTQPETGPPSIGSLSFWRTGGTAVPPPCRQDAQTRMKANSSARS